jgi:hypothetical protein
MLVAGSDRTINPELERWYAARAKSHKVEVAGASHVVYISHPKEVADLIEEAARSTSISNQRRAAPQRSRAAPACAIRGWPYPRTVARACGFRSGD